MRVLVLNAGSSSLKVSVVEEPGDRTLTERELGWGADATLAPERQDQLERVLTEIRGPDAPDAVAHRVVHGGPRFVQPTHVDDDVLAEIERLERLAPLHNRIARETIVAARHLLPDPPHVACFDTAFHATLPEEAVAYPIPAEWRRLGIRRFGFHGLSVAWAVERAAELLATSVDELRLVVAHLGSGCSVTAVSGGRSCATSMGFTPLEGLMMGTRSGSIDPGILLHMLREGHADLERLTQGLEHRSGLVGLSGTPRGARELEQAAEDGDPPARLALAVFARSAAAGIAAAATVLDRLDALVFTGGIGANSDRIRRDITDRLAVLGVESVSGGSGDDEVLTAGGVRPALLRVRAREDLAMARQTAALLA